MRVPVPSRFTCLSAAVEFLSVGFRNADSGELLRERERRFGTSRKSGIDEARVPTREEAVKVPGPSAAHTSTGSDVAPRSAARVHPQRKRDEVSLTRVMRRREGRSRSPKRDHPPDSLVHFFFSPLLTVPRAWRGKHVKVGVAAPRVAAADERRRRRESGTEHLLAAKGPLWSGVSAACRHRRNFVSRGVKMN